MAKKYSDEDIQNDCYAYIARFAEKIYESEEKREASVIEQAGRMQAAFSFVIAALFMLAQILVSNTVLSNVFLIVSISSVGIILLISLFLATFAQRRAKRAYFLSIKELNSDITNNYKDFLSPAQRDKYYSETYGELYDSLEKNNNQRIVCIRISMILFYIALGLCIFWFGIAIIKYREMI